MTARKSDDKGNVAEPVAEKDIKAQAEEGQVLDLEANDVSEAAPADANELVDVELDQGEENNDSLRDDEKSSDKEEGVALDEADEIASEQEAVKTDDGPVDEDAHSEQMAESTDAVPPVDDTSSTPAPAKKGSLGSGLIGGVLGGVVALGLGYGGLQQGLVSLPQNDAAKTEQTGQLDELKAALGALQEKVNAKTESPSVDLSGLEDRLAKAEGQLAEMSSKLQEVASSAVAAASNSASSQTGEGSEQASGQAAGAAPASVPSNAAANPLVDLTPLQDRIGALAVDLKALSERVDGFSTLSEQVAGAQSKVAELEKQAADFATAMNGQLEEAKLAVLASADRRIDNVVTDLTGMRQSVEEEAKALAARLTSLEDNNLSDKMQSSARTIALAGLQNAVASGESFAAALNTFAEVAADNEAVQALKAYGDAGAPTIAKLAGQFRTLSGKLLKAADEAAATSLVDKIMLNAQNLVRIRPIGEREGESLSDRLARIEVRINEGRLAEIAPEWDGLPDVAKKAGASWYEGVQARMAVDASMDVIRAEFGKDAAQ